MYGIRQFTAVINPPQAAILAVGEAVRQPVVGGDQVTIVTTMTVTPVHRPPGRRRRHRRPLPHRPQRTDRATTGHRALKSAENIFTKKIV
jgi:hypothetical protein